MQLGKEPLECDKCIFHPSADIGQRVPGSRSVPAVAVLDGSTQRQFGFCLSRDIKMLLKISSFVTNGVRSPPPFFLLLRCFIKKAKKLSGGDTKIKPVRVT